MFWLKEGEQEVQRYELSFERKQSVNHKMFSVTQKVRRIQFVQKKKPGEKKKKLLLK